MGPSSDKATKDSLLVKEEAMRNNSLPDAAGIQLLPESPSVTAALLKKKLSTSSCCSSPYSRSMNLLSFDLISESSAIPGMSRRSLPDLNQDLTLVQGGSPSDEDAFGEEINANAPRLDLPTPGYGQLMTKENDLTMQSYPTVTAEEFCCYVNGYKVPRKGLMAANNDLVSSHFALPPLKVKSNCDNENNNFEHTFNLKLISQDAESHQEEASLC